MAKRAKTDHEKKALLQIALAWHELAETGKLIPPLTRPKLKPKKY